MPVLRRRVGNSSGEILARRYAVADNSDTYRCRFLHGGVVSRCSHPHVGMAALALVGATPVGMVRSGEILARLWPVPSPTTPSGAVVLLGGDDEIAHPELLSSAMPQSWFVLLGVLMPSFSLLFVGKAVIGCLSPA